MHKHNFSVGDRATVVRNSERIPERGLIGMTGQVVGFKSNDASVLSEENGLCFIYENDLEKAT